MNKKKFFDNCYTCVIMMMKSNPVDTALIVGINLLYALTWMIQTVVLQYFFDTAQKASAGQEEAHVLIVALIAMGSAYLLYHLLDGFSNCYSEVLFLKISQKLNHMIFRRIGVMNAVEFEDAKRLDAIEKAKMGAMCFPGLFFTIIDILFYYVPYFIFMGWYLFRKKPIMTVSIIIVFIPTMVSKLAASFQFKELEEIEAPLRREMKYYEKCLAGREYIKETRIFGANTFFEKRYKEVLNRQNYFWMQVIIRQNLLQIGLKIVTAFGYGLIIWMLFCFVMNHEITVGVFAAVLATMSNLFRFMDKMVMERLGWATETVGAVENFLDFLGEPENKRGSKQRLIGKDIILNEVSFAYPQVQNKALEDITLKIESGQIIALVGENGSGKTTLARVITGLYEPTEGCIYYGDIPLKDYSREGISGVFQNFNRYQMTLRENISIGNQLKNNDERLEKICEEVNISLDEKQSSVQLDTMLGREFDGMDVSGGQWQRIAIGRGIYREHDVIVLDEPTAAIDPIEETKIYNEFTQICKGKTAILITHRLGATKLADRIIVLKAGHVVQEGTWNELLSKNGIFREMYESQKHWYEDNKVSG